ncbi:MAG: hypothetical protein IJC73_01190, partial [Lentisphaeria bacterium]|nr:hypothetical protein [Lentisphaeria bacterium]
MADYYLTVNGEYFDEAGDFNDGVSYFHELLASGTVSTLNVAGGTTSVAEGSIYANGANLNLTGGVFGNAIYIGWQTAPEETPITTQTVVVDGATIKGNLYLGNNAGTSSNNIDFTFKSGTITGQILGGNTGSVTGDVTISILGGISGNISGTAMGAGTTQGSTVINFENANYASKFMYAAYRGIPKDVTINFKSGLMHVVCLGAVSAGINLDCPITLNLSGGTVNWLIASYNGATRKGDTTINMTGGYVANYFFMGVNKAPSGVDAATFVETVGNNYFNLSGGTASAPCCAGGKFIQEGNNYINISGDFLGKNICGGAYATTGVVKGNVYITVNGGFWDKDHAYAPSYWINGGGYNGKVEGDITIDVLSGTLYHIFGGGREAGATTLGNININLKDGEFHGVVQGGGYKTSVTGDITINVSGGTFFREMKGKYGQSGWIIGGATHTTAASTEGDITVNVTGGTNLSTICGGNWSAISHVGNVALTISDVTLGFQTGEDTYEWGNVYAVAGSSTEVIGETFTADISNVTSNGTIYVCNGGTYIEGNTVITVKNSTFDALAIEYGSFTVTQNEETGENEYSDYYTTEINGNVLFDVTDVTIAGNAWGKGKNFDLASFVEEDQGATLAVSGKLTVGGEVAYFQNITIAAGATIEAGSVTASAITATAAAEDGAYLLATGFAAQDSVITVL